MRQNLTRSASELYTSQPALSMRISSLEKEVGCDLFDRSGNGIELNESGRVFLDYAQQIVRLYEEGVVRCRKAKRKVVVLIASFADGTMYDLLPPISEYPYRLVDLGIDTTCADAIADGAIDLAVDVDYSLIPELEEKDRARGLAYIPLDKVVSNGYFLAMMANHPLAGKRQLGRADLEGQTVVVNSGAYFDRWSLAVRHMIGAEVGLNFRMNQCLSTTDAAVSDFKDSLYVCGSESTLSILKRRSDVIVHRLLDGEPLTLPVAVSCREKDYRGERTGIGGFVRMLLA